MEERIAPGEVLPIGECPGCGAFCHYIEPRCGHCDRYEVCYLYGEAREVILDKRYYFEDDKDLIRTLNGVDLALAAGCRFFQKRGGYNV
jgi:hypothetical protein